MAQGNTVYGPVDTYDFPVPQNWPAGVAWAERGGVGAQYPTEAVEVHRIDADDFTCTEAPDSVGILDGVFFRCGQVIATVTD